MGKFPDISGAGALQMVLRTGVVYPKWKVEFGPAPKGSIFSPAGNTYKADFNLTKADNTWQTITVPFVHFSYKWSATTGEATTKCSDDPKVCPDASHLKALTTMEIAAEGATGKFHLEIKSISAVKMGQESVVV